MYRNIQNDVYISRSDSLRDTLTLSTPAHRNGQTRETLQPFTTDGREETDKALMTPCKPCSIPTPETSSCLWHSYLLYSTHDKDFVGKIQKLTSTCCLIESVIFLVWIKLCPQKDDTSSNLISHQKSKTNILKKKNINAQDWTDKNIQHILGIHLTTYKIWNENKLTSVNNPQLFL